MLISVGIDIGTSNCCVYAKKIGQAPELVPSQTGNALTPSMVSISNKDICVGDIAQQQQATNPLNTFYEFKRVIGRVYAQKELWHDAKGWPFHLGRPQNPDSEAPIYHAFHQNDLKSYSALDLTSMLAKQVLIDVSAAHPDCKIDNIVVTVPAHFDHLQRNSTLEAVKCVFLNVNINLCNEPTAAAVAYVNTHPGILKDNDTLLVFDFGAGTLDITLLTYAGADTYNVITSEGLGDLGGLNFTQAILQKFIQHVKDATKQDIRQDKALLALCRELCEKAKRALSVCSESSVILPNSPNTPAFNITRVDFERMISNDLIRCKDLLHAVIKNTRSTGHVVLVGGSARVPAVQHLIEQVLPNSIIHRNINMDQCVALGACYLASTSPTSVNERLSHGIGLKTAKKLMHTLLPRNQALPCEVSQVLYPQSTRQTCVEICLYQGEEKYVDENVLLGRLRLYDVQPNQPELKLHVAIDATGKILVEIKDLEGRTARSVMQYNGI